MAFDQPTRNRLARFVGDARTLLTEEFTRQLQREYGIDPANGEVADLDAKLGHLDDTRRATAQLLRETAEHYQPGFARRPAKERRETLDRIVREQAFTVLNRLCALRMAEARGLLIESVGRGPQSKGFQLFTRLAGPALGETGDAYRTYLFSLFDELAVDLPVLFDRFAPEGRLFPGEAALLRLLEQINHPEIEGLWAEDETVGWVYQYFNSKEERQAMRAESAAPRNSRELAVRNQFFTPRYVVEFLADNTLGRTWYEMTKGETGLVDSCRYLVRRPNEVFLDPGQQPPAQAEPAEELSQEELLRQTVYIPHRPLKDPRTILMLDPACGSMHFGLYAFDLFERIYEEAWEIEAERGPKALERAPMDAPLHEAYPDKEAYLRNVPRLIVERNIHGVDIDPRAAQIAALALWLRAQRSWRDQGVKAQDRPVITRSNIVCAEPMPGDPTMLNEFIGRHLVRTPEDQVIGEMLSPIFKAMELAGEAGSLLKIEEEIAIVIEAARRKYEQAQLKRRKEADYLPGFAPERDTTLFDLLDLPNAEEFWQHAEERIYAALRAYAEDAEDGGSYRRRLFADDAAQGFAFIDLCRRRYDVVLMNPPFGSPSLLAEQHLHKEFPESQYEVYGQFLVRASVFARNGLVGAITSRAFLFLANFLGIREFVYPFLSLFLDLGGGVLDGAAVEVCTFVLEPSRKGSHSYCIDLRSRSTTTTSTDEPIAYLKEYSSQIIFDTTLLSRFPAKPFCYDAPVSVLRMFGSGWTIETVTKGLARVGLATGDNDRFVRCYWEVPERELGIRWRWYAKGGEYLPYKPDVHLVVDWRGNGRLIEASFEGARIKKDEIYFRPAVTYSLRSQKGLSFRVLPEMCICSNKGPVIVAPGYEFAVLALSNSSAYKYLIEIQSAFSAYEVGTIQRAPVPANFQQITNELEPLGKGVLIQYMALCQLDETDVSFHLGSSLRHMEHINQFASQLGLALEQGRQSIAKYLKIIDRLVLSAYGWSEEHAPEDEHQKMLEMFTAEDISTITCNLVVSLCFGVAIGARQPDVFEPLTVALEPYKSLTTDRRVTFFDSTSIEGIIVDDEGHREDVVGRVREALQVIWGERAEAIEQEACEILGVKTLREYFRKPTLFFANHLARYSKSRRQAPIYWPLSTLSGSYTLWLYYHRLTDQTLYSCVNDFVEPKLAQVRQELAWIAQHSSGGSVEAREVERLANLETELQELRAELLRVAAFWKPNLNDGVQITAAPLWRLFQHKPWQKKLKETWESLERGDYDWAHLAYSIWPERVREKCKTDKSLAIAHGLEELYVEAPAVGKKGRGRGKKAGIEGGGMFEGE